MTRRFFATAVATSGTTAPKAEEEALEMKGPNCYGVEETEFIRDVHVVKYHVHATLRVLLYRITYLVVAISLSYLTVTTDRHTRFTFPDQEYQNKQREQRACSGENTASQKSGAADRNACILRGFKRHQ
eukprot:IDg5618t1